MSNSQIEHFSCGEVHEERELENREGCGEDFCENCLNTDGYCSDYR